MIKIVKKATSFFLIAALAVTPIAVTAQDKADSRVQSNGTYGAYIKSDLNITGDSGIENGDAFVKNGTVILDSWSSLTPGATLYKNQGASVSGSAYLWSDLKKQVKDYTEIPFDFEEYQYPAAPEGLSKQEDLTVGREYQNNYYELSQSGDYNKIDVNADGKLAFVADKGETLVIKVTSLSVNGEITVLGEGNVHLFVNEFKTGNTTVNPTGTKEQLSIVFTGEGTQTLQNLYQCNADFFSEKSALDLQGKGEYNSAFYISSSIAIPSSVNTTGLIYAPTVDLNFSGASVIKGFVVGNTISLSGSAKIIYGETTLDFDRFEKDPAEDLPEDPTPEINIYGEGKVISQEVVSRTENLPAYTLRFSTGPVNYGLWVSGTVENDCEIYVNGKKAYISSKTNEWSNKIALNQVQRGTTDVTIKIIKSNGDEITTTYVYDAYFPPVPADINNVPGTELYDITAGKPKNGTILVKGTYYDAYDVKPEIYVNGVKATVARMNNEEDLPFRNEENEFWATIAIPAGNAEISVTALNCYGTSSKASLNVFYYNDIDPATAPAPTLTGRAGSANSSHQAYIAGVVSDLNDTTVSVTVNGEPVYIGANGAYSIKLPVHNGPNQFVITATNVYGKQTTMITTRTYTIN